MPSQSSALLTPAQTGDLLGLTVGALAQMRYTGKGPRYVKLGRRAIRYRQDDIDEWVLECLRTRTDERSAPFVRGGAA